tara:strand:- start:465 stop:833 length:369 start_codon:yes stop_codon:yes gene_type:complete
MKTNELSGAALDWAVAKSELLSGADYTLAIDRDVDGKLRINFGGMYPEWSTDWTEGGAIIERERIELMPTSHMEWDAYKQNQHIPNTAATPLVAAMRCYVASCLGDDVELPEELDISQTMKR